MPRPNSWRRRSRRPHEIWAEVLCVSRPADEILEFDKLRALLRGHTTCAPGRRAVDALNFRPALADPAPAEPAPADSASTAPTGARSVDAHSLRAELDLEFAAIAEAMASLAPA